MRVLEVVLHAIAALGLGLALAVTFLHAGPVDKHIADVYNVWAIASAAWFLFSWVRDKRPITGT